MEPKELKLIVTLWEEWGAVRYMSHKERRRARKLVRTGYLWRVKSQMYGIYIYYPTDKGIKCLSLAG
jgi:hypothetical protein